MPNKNLCCKSSWRKLYMLEDRKTSPSGRNIPEPFSFKGMHPADSIAETVHWCPFVLSLAVHLSRSRILDTSAHPALCGLHLNRAHSLNGTKKANEWKMALAAANGPLSLTLAARKKTRPDQLALTAVKPIINLVHRPPRSANLFNEAEWQKPPGALHTAGMLSSNSSRIPARPTAPFREVVRVTCAPLFAHLLMK